MNDRSLFGRLLFGCIFALVLTFALPAAAYRTPPAPWAEGGPSRAEDLQIFLMTFGVGDDIASWFGHTALMVRDNGGAGRPAQERVYNYGMFDFGPDMLPKFLMGRLEFWVGEASSRGTLALYEDLNRDIFLTELNLPPTQRREMAAFLAWNVEPDNRDYLYHHYEDNCATRIRDAIDKAVGGQLAAATKSEASRTTYRGHTDRNTERNAYISRLLSMWMNDDIDQPLTEWEDMFLPEELLAQVEALEITEEDGTVRKLALPTETVFKSNRADVPHMPSPLWWTWIVGLTLGGLGLLFAQRWQTTKVTKWRLLLGGHHFVVGLLFGLPGLVAYLFHFTEHTITWWNENMLLWSPLTCAALPLSLAIMHAKPWALRWMRNCWYVMAATSLLAVVLKVLPMFDQSNGFALAMMVPFNVLMAVAMHRFGREAEVAEPAEEERKSAREDVEADAAEGA